MLEMGDQLRTTRKLCAYKKSDSILVPGLLSSENQFLALEHMKLSELVQRTSVSYITSQL